MTELRCSCQHPECRQAGRAASPAAESQPRVRWLPRVRSARASGDRGATCL